MLGAAMILSPQGTNDNSPPFQRRETDQSRPNSSLPQALTVAKAIQLIKGGSSKWMNDKSDRRSFAWQDSYGAFTIGISQVEETVRYINNQERHHLKVRFEDEFRKILERHGIKEFR